MRKSQMGHQLLGHLSHNSLNVGVVYPDPVHLNSCQSSQDHNVRSFSVNFQSLVVMSLNPDFVTWLNAMWGWGKKQTDKPGRWQAKVASGLYRRLTKILKTYVGYIQLRYHTEG